MFYIFAILLLVAILVAINRHNFALFQEAIVKRQQTKIESLEDDVFNLNKANLQKVEELMRNPYGILRPAVMDKTKFHYHDVVLVTPARETVHIRFTPHALSEMKKSGIKPLQLL